MNQDAEALEGIWQFMLGVLDLGQVRNVTWIWSWALQKMKFRFSQTIRQLWDKWQILRNSIVSCFHLWWCELDKCEYSRPWRVFSDIDIFWELSLTHQGFYLSAIITWPLIRYVPLRKLNSLWLSFVISKTEIICIYLRVVRMYAKH